MITFNRFTVDTMDRQAEMDFYGVVSIGCKTFTLAEFRKRLPQLALENDVGDAAVEEYYRVFDLFEKVLEAAKESKTARKKVAAKKKRMIAKKVKAAKKVKVVEMAKNAKVAKAS